MRKIIRVVNKVCKIIIAQLIKNHRESKLNKKII